MSFAKVIFVALACAPLCCTAGGLIVAPGQSVTLVDAADPSMQVVVSAPADAALDLGALLTARGKSSILSIVTGAQVKAAGSMTKNKDGTISIAPAAAPAASQALLADRAVLVFNDGRYVGVADQPKINIPVREPVNLGALVASSTVRLPAAISASNALAPSPSSSPSRLPSPAPVVTGTASINPASTLAIGSLAPGAINWSQFNISSSGTVSVMQPSPSTATLNRVTGNISTLNIITSTGSISVGGGSITTSSAPAPNSSVTVK